MKLMMRIAMHTALISFAVYEKAEWIRKINIVTRLQNMRQESHPTVLVGTYQPGKAWHRNHQCAQQKYLYNNTAKHV